jgi:DNA-binding CsgD family transcriptional regulator
MWNERRAASARRNLAALEGTARDSTELIAAAAEIVGTVVPYDATCWATVDPASSLLTGSVTIAFDPTPELEAQFAEIEVAGEDLHPFRQLMTGTPIARLSDVDRYARESSPRLDEIYRPLGLHHELRVAFVVDERCWAVAGLLRSPVTRDFDDEEVGFLRSVSTSVAKVVRSAVTAGARNVPSTAGPAVVVLDGRGVVVATTPLAEERLQALERTRRGTLGIALRSVVSAVGVAGTGIARARLRDSDGSWVSLNASPLLAPGAPPQIVVSIEPIGPSDLTNLLLDAHGLTARERDVCHQVLDGRSTAEVSAALYISANTVQDHLKSIFAKTGVRSRRELVAYLNDRKDRDEA